MKLDIEPERERRIARMTALRVAADIVAGQYVTLDVRLEETKRVATELVAWIFEEE